MPCPKCHSHRIWDDNLAWGCCDCDFFTTGEIVNRGNTSRDVFHVPDGSGLKWVPEKAPGPPPQPEEHDE